MPPRSEFASEMNVDGPAIKVEGESVLEGPRADEVLGPVELHFLIEQKGLVAHGTMPLESDTWGATVQAAGEWNVDEPACATGLAVQVREAPIAAIETFTWSVIVKLKRGPVT